MKWERVTHRDRRPRPLSITPVAITGEARAEERARGGHRADSTKPRGAGAVHRLRQERDRLSVYRPASHPFLFSQVPSLQLSPVRAAGGSAQRAPGYQSPRTELGWGPGE